jgi:hypothetical protein
MCQLGDDLLLLPTLSTRTRQSQQKLGVSVIFSARTPRAATKSQAAYTVRCVSLASPLESPAHPLLWCANCWRPWWWWVAVVIVVEVILVLAMAVVWFGVGGDGDFRKDDGGGTGAAYCCCCHPCCCGVATGLLMTTVVLPLLGLLMLRLAVVVELLAVLLALAAAIACDVVLRLPAPRTAHKCRSR